ncbi:MAG: bile acid:sodium symporter [Deltaproteobacteria bacterium]|nr:bile acid:sodium symporter [Deltaproteobacteria bacterium]
MTLLDKLEPVLLALAAGLGLALGRLTPWGPFLGFLVQPLLILMLFGVFWETPLKNLKKGLLNVKFAAVSLTLNFVWIPILGWLLAAAFLADQPDLSLGFVMLLITPCTDWYLVFTALAKGDTSLSASILPINLLAQLALMPFLLKIFGGLGRDIGAWGLLWAVVPVLFAPLAAARLLRRLVERPDARGPSVWPAVGQAVDRLAASKRMLYLQLAVVCMFAGEGRHILDRLDVFWALLPPVLLFFLVSLAVSTTSARLSGLARPQAVSLIFTTLARNSPVALAVAVSAFPDRPLAALALVIGPLVELPVLALCAKAVLALGRRGALGPG